MVRRSRPLALLLTLFIGVPVVLATDRFADVPTAHDHHNDINKIAGAGITTGCGGANYCPDVTVTRGQMASFLSRGLGRTAHSGQSVPLTPTGAFGEASWAFTITPGLPAGALAGSTGYINAVAVVTIRSTDTNPCRAGLALRNETDAVWMNAQDAEVNPIAAVTGKETLTVIGQSTVSSSGQRSIRVNVFVQDIVDSTACTATILGDAQATYVPFGP